MYDARSRPTLAPNRKLRPMRARGLPGALALGLLAATIAHAIGYGNSHAMGGPYHGLLFALCGAAGIGALVFAASLAWASAGRMAQGSVLAARLRDHLPGVTALTASATLWFALAESVEPHHEAASPVMLLAALVIAAWLVSLLARGALAIVATIVLAFRAAGTIADLVATPKTRFDAAPRARRLLRASPRYARPPPLTVTGA